MKNGENNGALASVSFLSPLRATSALALKFPLPLPFLTPTTQAKRERMQLVYEIILLNKILTNHLLSENLQ